VDHDALQLLRELRRPRVLETTEDTYKIKIKIKKQQGRYSPICREMIVLEAKYYSEGIPF
jgi:hypothetical protein